jgi:glyoxylase-like metal-dependent hydrolase (beta-lactamase superfamily II)
MKRLFALVGLVALVVVVALAAAIMSVSVGRRGPADGVEVGGVRIVRDGMVSLAVVPAGEGQVALIDAGNRRTGGQAVMAELSRRGLGPEAVSAILLTHGHMDHIGAISSFPEAQVMALEADAPLIEGRARSRGLLLRLFPVRPTGVTVGRILRDGDTISLGPARIRAFAVPGHTAGSAAYLVNGVLLLGDAADANDDGEVISSPWVVSDSRAEGRASIARLVQRLLRDSTDVTAVVFSHSGVLEDGLTRLMAFAQLQR